MRSERSILGAIVLVVLVLVLLGGVGMMGLGGMGMWSGMMGGYSGYGGYPGMMNAYGVGLFAALVNLVFRLLIIGALVFLGLRVLRNMSHGETSTGSNEAPIDILKKRYARGEITKEQFDSIKHDLSN